MREAKPFRARVSAALSSGQAKGATMRKLVFLALLMAAGCSKQSGETKVPPVAGSTPIPASTTYKTPQGTLYRVSRVPGVKPSDLPTNADLKMADSDLAKYAQTACTLDTSPKYAPDRCDIYAQPDPIGTLIGYAVVTQDKQGVSFDTTTTLNEKREPGGRGCSLSGKLDGDETPIMDASKNFDGHSMYLAWEKAPGEYIISPATGGADDTAPDHALGVWYVKRMGDKLRITQERWNYCYKDSNVYVDDVFYRVITLIKVVS